MRILALCVLSLVIPGLVIAQDRATLGVVGASVDLETTMDHGQLSWVAILARLRSNQVDFGQTGDWGEPRLDGFEFNWAVGGASAATGMVQAEGVARQKVDYVSVGGLGLNDLLGANASVIFGGADPTDVIDTLEQNLRKIVARVSESENGPKVILWNLADVTAAPFMKNSFPDPAVRERMTRAVVAANQRIEDIAKERGLPVIDTFGLSQLAPEDPTICGVPLLGGKSVDRLFCSDGIHPGTFC